MRWDDTLCRLVRVKAVPIHEDPPPPSPDEDERDRTVSWSSSETSPKTPYPKASPKKKPAYFTLATGGGSESPDASQAEETVGLIDDDDGGFYLPSKPAEAKRVSIEPPAVPETFVAPSMPIPTGQRKKMSYAGTSKLSRRYGSDPPTGDIIPLAPPEAKVKEKKKRRASDFFKPRTTKKEPSKKASKTSAKASSSSTAFDFEEDDISAAASPIKAVFATPARKPIDGLDSDDDERVPSPRPVKLARLPLSKRKRASYGGKRKSYSSSSSHKSVVTPVAPRASSEPIIKEEGGGSSGQKKKSRSSSGSSGKKMSAAERELEAARLYFARLDGQGLVTTNRI